MNKNSWIVGVAVVAVAVLAIGGYFYSKKYTQNNFTLSSTSTQPLVTAPQLVNNAPEVFQKTEQATPTSQTATVQPKQVSAVNCGEVSGDNFGQVPPSPANATKGDVAKCFLSRAVICAPASLTVSGSADGKLAIDSKVGDTCNVILGSKKCAMPMSFMQSHSVYVGKDAGTMEQAIFDIMLLGSYGKTTDDRTGATITASCSPL